MKHDITDAHWVKITTQAIPMLLREAGEEATTESCIMCFKIKWKLLGDEAALDVYIRDRLIVELETQKAANVIANDVIDAELAELEA